MFHQQYHRIPQRRQVSPINKKDNLCIKFLLFKKLLKFNNAKFKKVLHNIKKLNKKNN